MTMRRREFLYAAGGSLAAASVSPAVLRALAQAGPAAATGPAHRGLRIVLPTPADPALGKVAQTILAAVPQHPLLSAMAGSAGAQVVDFQQTLASSPTSLAYNHLVLIGTPDADPVQSAWQREASVDYGGRADDIYIYGFGHLRGDIGYIESDRNPFLHAANIPFAPYETEIVTLSGTSPAGIAAAANAFLARSLVNGIVAAPGWTRPERTLLDRDPLPVGFVPPALAPATRNGMTRIAVTQAGEDEYRGVLADTGVEPAEIWRFKYLAPNGWDIARSVGAFDAYAAGLHRRAYGNTLWLARFTDANAAQSALPKIAAAARLQQTESHPTPQFRGAQPPYATGTYPGERPSPGPLSLTRQGPWLEMATF
jgi:hypothetical protein